MKLMQIKSKTIDSAFIVSIPHLKLNAVLLLFYYRCIHVHYNLPFLFKVSSER